MGVSPRVVYDEEDVALSASMRDPSIILMRNCVLSKDVPPKGRNSQRD
jgi:hypothetical protein